MDRQRDGSHRGDEVKPLSHDAIHSSEAVHYSRPGAVASDSELCSKVGMDVMNEMGGNAVDAAIATMLCVGVVYPYGTGIGGGTFITIYKRKETMAYAVNARCVAPAAATERMFFDDNCSPEFGGLAIAVPGEVRGMHLAHERFGHLPWSSLFEPAIRLAEDGILVHKHLCSAMKLRLEIMRAHPSHNLSEVLLNPVTGNVYEEGDVMKQPRLARNLRIIAKDGPRGFYNGNFAQDIVDDIKDTGGIITVDDLSSMSASWEDPIQMPMPDEMTFHSAPLPATGVLVAFILNILFGYQMDRDSISTHERTALNYHRMIEAFKFAFAERTHLGDPKFINIDEIVQNFTSVDYGNNIRSRISDTHTQPTQYYGNARYDEVAPGTNHVCVLDSNGDAVSMTSTINLGFGAKIVGKRTGIIFNSTMDDFCTSDKPNHFGIHPSAANAIRAGKRPLSAMAPIIVTDKQGDVVLIAGSAGGSLITTAVAQTVLQTLWFKQGLERAMTLPRLHHQLLPDVLEYEDNFPEETMGLLKEKGHSVLVMPRTKFATVTAIYWNGLNVESRLDLRKCEQTQGY